MNISKMRINEMADMCKVAKGTIFTDPTTAKRAIEEIEIRLIETKKDYYNWVKRTGEKHGAE